VQLHALALSGGPIAKRRALVNGINGRLPRLLAWLDDPDPMSPVYRRSRPAAIASPPRRSKPPATRFWKGQPSHHGVAPRSWKMVLRQSLR